MVATWQHCGSWFRINADHFDSCTVSSRLVNHCTNVNLFTDDFPFLGKRDWFTRSSLLFISLSLSVCVCAIPFAFDRIGPTAIKTSTVVNPSEALRTALLNFLQMSSKNMVYRRTSEVGGTLVLLTISSWNDNGSLQNMEHFSKKLFRKLKHQNGGRTNISLTHRLN
jgi:hypothetical protein